MAGETRIGAAPKQKQGWLDVLKQALGPTANRPTPWTPPDLALDPIRALIARLMMPGGMANQGDQLGMARAGMLGGPNAHIGAPPSATTSAAVLPKAARKQLKRAAKPKSIDDKMARGTMQMAGVPMHEFDSAVGGLGKYNFLPPEELVGALQAAPAEPAPLPSGNVAAMGMAPSVEGQAPPAEQKRNAIIRALMMGIGR